MKRSQTGQFLPTIFFCVTAVFLAGCRETAEVNAHRTTVQILSAAGRIELIQTDRQIVIGLLDFDILMQRTEALQGVVDFLAPGGAAIDTFQINYKAPTARSHHVFQKRKDRQYGDVRFALKQGERTLLREKFRLPESVQIQSRVFLKKEKAAIVPGTAEKSAGPLPSILLPDFSKVPAAESPSPQRTIDLQKCVRPVRSDGNIPQIGSNNNSIISRQTAYPEDTSRQSLYISLMAPLFDSQSAKYDSNFRFLVEIPLEEEWMKGDGNSEFFASPEKMKVHMTDETLEFFRLGKQRVTGSREGGLMQGIQSVVKDEEGNLYFGIQYRSPIRFNIRKARWENPPLNVYEWLLQHKPKTEQMPYAKGKINSVRFDFSNTIFYHEGRIYVSLNRYAIFGDSIGLACVVSIPIEQWSNPEKFRKAVRLNASAWPNGEFPLFDKYVDPEDKLKKLNWTMGVGNRLCLLSYHRNYLWTLDVNDDGSTRKLLRIDRFKGNRIVKFKYPSWVLIGQKCLGLQVTFVLDGEEKETKAFLPIDGADLVSETPAGTYLQPFLYNHPGPIGGERVYGRTEIAKKTIGLAMRKYDEAGTGKAVIYYDALRVIRADKKHQHLIEMMEGPSLGPAYYLIPVPGKTSQLLGNAEYLSYYHSLFDLNADASIVRKKYLQLDAGNMATDLAVEASIGPICHTWVNEHGNDVLYYAGYTGICRMIWRRNGEALTQFKVDNLTYKMPHEVLDGSPHGHIKWFRAMAPGLGDKILLTGIGQANRGGTAWSNGLMYFHRNKADRLYKLSRMSAAHTTRMIASQVVVKPNSGMVQRIFLGGNHSQQDAVTMPDADRPADAGPKLFLYQDEGGERIQDIFGFSVSRGEPGLQDISFSRNQLYLIILYKDGTLATFDPATLKFVDAVRTNPRQVSLTGSRKLFPMPDGDQMFLTFDDDERKSATFTRISVGTDGRISATPILRCTINSPDQLNPGRSLPAAFLYDHSNDDGSYDFVIGPNPSQRSTWCIIIRDFIPSE